MVIKHCAYLWFSKLMYINSTGIDCVEVWFGWVVVHMILVLLSRLLVGSTRLGMTCLQQEMTLKVTTQHPNGSASSVSRSLVLFHCLRCSDALLIDIRHDFHEALFISLFQNSKLYVWYCCVAMLLVCLRFRYHFVVCSMNEMKFIALRMRENVSQLLCLSTSNTHKQRKSNGD